MSRVAIYDFDAHHGNGTQDAFYGDADVLYISHHQDGSFPGTGRADEMGEGEGKGTTLNVPLPAGSGDGTSLCGGDGVDVDVGRCGCA